MGMPVLLMNSLKTRLVIGSLAIFLASLWSLWFYVSHTLRMDMERLLGEQQFSTVSLVADRVDHEFEDRIEWSCPVCDKPKVDDDAAAFGFDKYSRTAD